MYRHGWSVLQPLSYRLLWVRAQTLADKSAPLDFWLRSISHLDLFWSTSHSTHGAVGKSSTSLAVTCYTTSKIKYFYAFVCSTSYTMICVTRTHRKLHHVHAAADLLQRLRSPIWKTNLIYPGTYYFKLSAHLRPKVHLTWVSNPGTGKNVCMQENWGVPSTLNNAEEECAREQLAAEVVMDPKCRSRLRQNSGFFCRTGIRIRS